MVRKAKAEILHDYFDIREGGGRLALTLGMRWGWPVTGGFVSRDIPFGQEWPGVALRELGIVRGFGPCQAISLTKAWSRYRSRARTVVHSGTYAPMAAINQPYARNILYCHSPPRFIYDQRSFYLSSIPYWQRPAFEALVRYLKPRYERAVSCMDRVVVNSENVQRRLERYLCRSSVVVSPPCDVDMYHWQQPEGYYLSTARLDRLKRVDLVVRAFKEEMPDKKLVVVSDGPDRRHIENLAAGAPNVEFLGGVDDQRLRELIGKCISTVYIPRDEDFGMSPVESMAAGKPVIGVAEGGLCETVMDGETGILLPEDPGVDDLVRAVNWCTSVRARDMRKMCERRAWEFRTEVFLKRMREVVEQD